MFSKKTHLKIALQGWGYDFRDNLEVAFEAYGSYATDLFTLQAEKVVSEHNSSQPLFLYMAHLAVHSANFYSPLQAPLESIRKFAYIQDPQRRRFAAMLDKLDQSVGRLISALQQKQMLHNSIILFTTDNGGEDRFFALKLDF